MSLRVESPMESITITITITRNHGVCLFMTVSGHRLSQGVGLIDLNCGTIHDHHLFPILCIPQVRHYQECWIGMPLSLRQRAALSNVHLVMDRKLHHLSLCSLGLCLRFQWLSDELQPYSIWSMMITWSWGWTESSLRMLRRPSCVSSCVWCLDWWLCTWYLDDCHGWCLLLSPKGICLLNSMYDGCFLCCNEEWSIWDKHWPRCDWHLIIKNGCRQARN